MQFKESFITDAGNKLLSESISNSEAATKSILWTKARTSSDASIVNKTRKDIQTLTDISSYSSSGFVTNAIHSETTWAESAGAESLNHHTTSLVCEITNKDYNGAAYSLGVWGKLVYSDGTEGSETLIAVARIQPTDEPDIIPSADQSVYAATVTFVISIDDHAVNLIQAPDSFYATAQNLQSLENRAVTTHLEGSATTGEKQNIYGDKTFKNKASVEGAFSVKSNTTLANANTNNITPSVSSTYSLGTDKLRWENVYTDHLYGITHGNIIAEEGRILQLTSQLVTGTNDTGTSNLTVVGSLVGNATTATTATNLANAPSLSFTNATSSSSGSTLTVTAGGKTSTSATLTTVRQAYQPYVNTTSGNSVYPLTFAPAVTKEASITAGFKSLFTDSYNNLYYNPSTNTLTCPNFSGNATTATTATNLANAPSLRFTNATSALSGSNLTVTVGGKTSTAATLTTVRQAYRPYLNTSDTNAYYPLVFTTNVSAGSSIAGGFKPLYTDTENNCYYNPSTNTLICPNFNGTATYAKYDISGYPLEVSAYITSIGSYRKYTESIEYLKTNGVTGTYTGKFNIPNGKLYALNSEGTTITSSIDIAAAVAGILSNCSTAVYNVGCITMVMFKTTGTGFEYTANFTVGNYIILPKSVFLFSNGTDNNTVLRMSGKYSAETASTLGGVWKLLTNIGNVASGNYAYALAVRIF